MVRRISVKPKDGIYDSGSEYRSHRGKSLWVSNVHCPSLKSQIMDDNPQVRRRDVSDPRSHGGVTFWHVTIFQQTTVSVWPWVAQYII